MAHKHGEMDIQAQQKTFDSFITFATRFSIFVILFLIFLALTGA
ncbi:MAG: aa3-type cytochrome c oxidase subunit IV [Rhodobacterales bacterium]|nr:MAG: aa3-type cytochrome c oxidase subunit IV [Rhodobacterales bacterium]